MQCCYLSLFKMKTYDDKKKLQGTHGFIQNLCIRSNHLDIIYKKYNFFLLICNEDILENIPSEKSLVSMEGDEDFLPSTRSL